MCHAVIAGVGIANERYSASHTADDPSGFSRFINIIFFHSQLINPTMNNATCMLQFVGSHIQAGICALVHLTARTQKAEARILLMELLCTLGNSNGEMEHSHGANTPSHGTQSGGSHSEKQPFTSLPTQQTGMCSHMQCMPTSRQLFTRTINKQHIYVKVKRDQGSR